MSFPRIVTLALLSIFSSSAFAGPRSTGGSKSPGDQSEAQYAFVISFQSIGSGIDRDAREAYFDIVKDNFMAAKAVKLLERIAGREGEIISCIQFKEETNRISAQKELTNLLETSTLTTIKTVTQCDEASLKP